MPDSVEGLESPPATEHLLSGLRDLYRARNKSDEFQTEEVVFKELLPKLIDSLKPLILLNPFALGSTATVWEVQDPRLKQNRALKLPRPKLGKLDKIIRIIRAEGNRLAQLTHQNITKIHLSDEVKIVIEKDEYSFPYFLMDYLEGVKDFGDYLIENSGSLDGEAIISYFRHAMNGLYYLHANDIIHCDIKPGNIIIAPNSPALIADLGYAKHLERIPGNHDKMTDLIYTPPYAHPDLIKNMVKSTDSAANIAEIKRSELKFAYDLYALGRTFQEVLRALRGKVASDRNQRPIFSLFQWRYLALIAVRLLDGQVEKKGTDPLMSDLISGLPPSAMPQIAYRSAGEALEDLEKLLNYYDLEGEIPELNPNLNTYIQLPGSRAPLTKRVSRLINHPAVTRLAQVTQLGFVSLVYPGATYSRFEHSLGTFAKCCEIIRSLWYDRECCLFRSIMSKADIEALMISSLLHDIGQYPLAHELTEVHQDFSPDCFTRELIFALDSNTEESIADVILSEWGVKPNRVVDILTGEKTSDLKIRILNSIISGPLDADKLDYIDRDSLHTGVTFGRDIDHGRLLRNLTICCQTDRNNEIGVAELGVTEKARAVAESIWRARREMFRQVYWHHSMRALKSMLMFVVRRVLIRLTKEEKEFNAFKSQLHLFSISPTAFCQLPLPRSQIQLDTHTEEHGSESFDIFGFEDFSCFAFSHISPTDDAFLSFISGFSDNVEKNVLEMIRRRDLFKRVAVLSHNQQKEKFESIYDRYRQERLRGYLSAQEERRKNLENAILAKIKEDPRMYLDSADIPIVLLDVPLKALRDPAGNEALWYVPEEQLGLNDETSLGLNIIAKSDIQIEKTTFDKEVGKIRVLAHPSCHQIIRHDLKDREIIDLLITA